MKIFEFLFKKKPAEKPVEINCKSCKFNDGLNCSVGTHYAKHHGTNAICFEGELWEKR